MTQTIPGVEGKARYVRNASYWGKPYGTPILPGQKPQGPVAAKLRRQGKPVPDNFGLDDTKPATAKAPRGANSGIEREIDEGGLFPVADAGPTRRVAAGTNAIGNNIRMRALADALDSAPENYDGSDPARFGPQLDEIVKTTGFTPDEFRAELDQPRPAVRKGDDDRESIADEIRATFPGDEDTATAALDKLTEEYRFRYFEAADAQGAPDAEQVANEDRSAATSLPTPFRVRGMQMTDMPKDVNAERQAAERALQSGDEAKLTAALETLGEPNAGDTARKMIAGEVDRPEAIQVFADLAWAKADGAGDGATPTPDAPTTPDVPPAPTTPDVPAAPEVPETPAVRAPGVNDLLKMRGTAVTTKLVPAQVSAIRAATPAQRATWAEEAGAQLDTIYARGPGTDNRAMYLNTLVDALKRDPGAIAVDAMLESRNNQERNALLAELDATDLAAATKENDERLALLKQRARPAERPGLNRRERLAALLAKATAKAETSTADAPAATDLDAVQETGAARSSTGPAVDPAATRQRIQSNRGRAEWVASATDAELRAELANLATMQSRIGNSVASDGRTHVKFGDYRKVLGREQARRAKGGTAAPKADIAKMRGFLEKDPTPRHAGHVVVAALFRDLDGGSRSVIERDIDRIADGRDPGVPMHSTDTATPLDDVRRQRLAEIADVIEQTGVDLGDGGDFVRRLRGETAGESAGAPEVPESPTPDAPYAPTGNMNAPEDLTPEQLDAEIDAAKALRKELVARRVPSNSAQLADAKMRVKVFEDEKRKRDAAAPAEVPAAAPAESAPGDAALGDGTAEGETGDEPVGLFPSGRKPSPKLVALLGQARQGEALELADDYKTRVPISGWIVSGHANTIYSLRKAGLARTSTDNAMVLNERGARLMAPYLPGEGNRDMPESTPDAPEASGEQSTVDAPPVPDAPAPAADTAGPAVPPDEQRVRDAVDKLTTRPGAWVNLTRLRKELADVDPDELDQTLSNMMTQDDVFLIPEANAKMLSEEDHDNALFLGGEERHLISIYSNPEPEPATSTPDAGVDAPPVPEAPDTPDAEVPPAPDADAARPDTLTLPDGRTLPRDDLDEQEAEFLTDRWTLRDDDGRVRATVERDTDGDYTWSVIGEDGQARVGYGARTPEDAQDRLAEQLGALPGGDDPAVEPSADTAIDVADLDEVGDTSAAAEGLIEAEDGELEVSPDVAERQDRVEALLTGTPDLASLDDTALGGTRRDVVDELRLQEEIARRDRARGTAGGDKTDDTPSTQEATDTAPSPDDAVESAPAAVTPDTAPEPTGPKPRPGVAGAAEDLADALEAGDEARTTAARARLDSSLRRSRSDSPIVAEMRTMLETDPVDPAALRDAAERLRAETREKRNAGARSRRLAKRLERERLRSLLGEIDAEMRGRNLNPDEFGGTAPGVAPEGGDTIAPDDVAAAQGLAADPEVAPDPVPAPEIDDVIAPDDVAAAQELGAEVPAAPPAAPAEEPVPPAPAAQGSTPSTYGELKPGDVYPSPDGGDPVTVDRVVPRGDQVEVHGSLADGRGLEFNLLPANGPIPGAGGSAAPVTDPTAPSAPITTRPLPDTPHNRLKQARTGDKFRARAGGAGAEVFEFENLADPIDRTAVRPGTGVIALDVRSNTLGEGRLMIGTGWDGTESLSFTADRDGREILLSPSSLERSDGLVPPTTPEGSYRSTESGASIVVGRNYVAGIRQVSPRRWVWTAELYGPDGKLVASGGDKVDNPEAARRAVRDKIESGYVNSTAYGTVAEGETLPTVPDAADAPPARSVSIPDAPPAYSGPVNAITGLPDYTEAPELMPRAIATPRAGWTPEEIRAGIIAAHADNKYSSGRGEAIADDIDWDSVIIAPGGGLMAFRPLRPIQGQTGYSVAGTENGFTVRTGSVSLDRSAAVSMMNTLTRGITPAGDQIDWGLSTRADESGRHELGRQIRRLFPDGEMSIARWGLSTMIADKIAKNQASSPAVRNAKGLYGITRPSTDAEYPNAADAERHVVDNIGALRTFLNDGKRKRERWATDDRTDEEIKDDGETIRTAQGADALFDLGAPDKAVALIERRIDELESIYGASDYDATKGDAGARGSIMLRRVADAMRDAYNPEPLDMAALRGAKTGDRLMMVSSVAANGRDIYRVKYNTQAQGGGRRDDDRTLTVVREGGTGRDERLLITSRGVKFDDHGGNGGFDKKVVRLAPGEVAPEGKDAVADRIAQRAATPALDDAIAIARANLDAAFGPITREQPKRASQAAKRTKTDDAKRSSVVDRPQSTTPTGMAPDVADRILQVQTRLVNVRTGADFDLIDATPAFGVHEKIGDVKGTWGEGNTRNDDAEFWRTARLSAGGAFVTSKDGSILHAETGLLLSSGLADQALADRTASYLERLVDPETGRVYDWNDPAAVAAKIRTDSLRRAGAADAENPTAAERASSSQFNPFIGVRKQAELDELVARGPFATRKATATVQAQFDTGDWEGHRPSLSTAPYTALTGVEPGRKGDYPDLASGKNVRKLDGVVNWAATLAPVRPYDAIAGLRAAAESTRDLKITRNVRGKKESSYGEGPVVDAVRGTVGEVLDKMADELERDTDPQQWTEMQKLDRAGKSGDLKVTGAKVAAQELVSGRGNDENAAYAQKIADAIKANGVRLDWVDENTYRTGSYGSPVPPHYRLTVPGVSGVGDYRDAATGDLMIEQIDQYNKGVQMDGKGNVTASWRSYNPDGPEYAETIMTLRFDDGQWTFVDKDSAESAPDVPEPTDLDNLESP